MLPLYDVALVLIVHPIWAGKIYKILIFDGIEPVNDWVCHLAASPCSKERPPPESRGRRFEPKLVPRI